MITHNTQKKESLKTLDFTRYLVFKKIKCRYSFSFWCPKGEEGDRNERVG
jgi:hypothetical protein